MPAEEQRQPDHEGSLHPHIDSFHLKVLRSEMTFHYPLFQQQQPVRANIEIKKKNLH